jgi:post-segregation antitoxin (ccd killing protein)
VPPTWISNNLSILSAKGWLGISARMRTGQQVAMAAPGITNRILGKTLANRSISVSLDEQLLEQLDAQGANRSALVSEALTMWLARRHVEALNQAYADLACLDSGDLAAAGDAAVSMAQEAFAAGAHG